MRLLEFLATSVVALSAVMFAATSAIAQDSNPPEASNQDPLLDLHERARTKFQELHRSMQRLQSIKQGSDPDESRLLQSGNRFIQEKRLNESMEAARGLIESGDYDRALEEMQQVGDGLESLLQLLLNRDLELQRLMERIEQLEGFRDRVDELIEEQDEAKDAAAEAEALLKHLENLEKAQAELEKLIDAQVGVREEANQEGMSATPERAAALAEAEQQLEDATAKLAETLDEVEDEAAELVTEKADAGDSSKTPGEAGESSGKPGSSSPSKSASKAAKGAGESMGKAGNKLEDNQPESSLDEMDKAVEKLEKAKSELEKLSDEARRRLQKLPFDLQRRMQESTRVDTDNLAQDMENAEQGDGESGEPTPGKKDVQQAVPKQKAAAGQLRDRKPGDAKQKQQDASDDLENAKQELEDALAQLRQQLEDEVLRALEERLGEMLARQKEISARTEAIDRVRGAASTAAGATVPVKVRNSCAELSMGEFDLGGEASDALKLIEEDGRSAAFPILVEEVRDDLNRIGDRLGEFRTAAATQEMQAEVVATLEDLLNALRKTIEERQGGT